MQERVTRCLNEQWPGSIVVSEEMDAKEQAQLLAGEETFWCLDPLDGTSNFAAGIPFFSTALALVRHGRVELAVVYDPLRRECFTAAYGQCAMLNGSKLQLHHSGLTLRQASAIVDFKRLPADLAARMVTDKPYFSQRCFGSAALEWCWLAAGRGHIYLHGQQYIWDYAAGHLVFQESGGHSTTLSGKAVRRLPTDTQPSTVIAAVDSDLFLEWTKWLDVSFQGTPKSSGL